MSREQGTTLPSRQDVEHVSGQGPSEPGDAADAAKVRFVGHATVLIEMAGVRLLTDPVLRGRVAHLGRRASAPPADELGPIDAVLISHAHHDHLDAPSLRSIGKEVRLLVPTGLGRWLAWRGFRRVEELRPGDAAAVGPLRVVATPARHDGSRFPFGPRAGCLGFVVEGPPRIYFAGDTDVFPEMADLPPIDLALLPVWGWGLDLGRGHLDPVRAVEALRLLRPDTAVPIHWGTLHPIGFGRWTREAHARPPLAFARLARAAVPEVAIRILDPGDEMELRPRTAAGPALPADGGTPADDAAALTTQEVA